MPGSSPPCEDSARHDTGYVELPNKQDGRLFYWYAESRGSPATDPLILWLSGGPGCSSLWALLAENGPCTVNPDGRTTTRNPFSWTTSANVVWLDQPVFTGFSLGHNDTDADRSSQDVAVSLYHFLHGFYRHRHPELRGRAIFLAGESYAGHFIPPAARYILERNQEIGRQEQQQKQQQAAGKATAFVPINLAGLVIGNGYVAPSIQTASFLEMANNSYGIQLTDDADLASIRTLMGPCLGKLQECQQRGADAECIAAAAACAMVSVFPDRPGATTRNPYDIRLECSPTDPLCYNTSHVASFLNLPQVQQALGVHKAWEACNDAVHEAFFGSKGMDPMVDQHQHVAYVLDHSDARVLVYAGDADTVCNWIGNHEWTKRLDWSHAHAFRESPERGFITSTQITAGIVHALGTKLTFLRVFDAGHMVPMDQPAVALDMISRFLRNESLFDQA